MKIVGLTLARNEDWIIGYSLRAALRWCDEIVVLDHASTDSTGALVRAISNDAPGRVHYEREDDPVWKEMEYRQRLLDRARSLGATHLAIVDADEVLTANLLPSIRDYFSRLREREILQFPMIPIWGSPLRRRVDNCVWTRARITLGFRDHPDLFWKAKEDGYDFHHREPYNSVKGISVLNPEQGGVMHYQWATRRRLVAKQALYKATEVLRWPGREPVAKVDARYNPATDERGLLTVPINDHWVAAYGLDLEMASWLAEPWQEAELNRLITEHGRERFAGLNFFGVV